MMSSAMFFKVFFSGKSIKSLHFEVQLLTSWRMLGDRRSLREMSIYFRFLAVWSFVFGFRSGSVRVIVNWEWALK